MTNGSSSPAGWYQDPTGQGDARYWNGTAWTQSVDQGGQKVNVPIDPTQAQQPPVPGTQVQLPPTTTNYVEPQSSSRSPWGAIFGVLLVLVVVVGIFVIVANDDASDDSPTPGTDVAPATEPAPATDPPDDGG